MKKKVERFNIAGKEFELFEPSILTKALLYLRPVNEFIGKNETGIEYVRTWTKTLLGKEYIWKRESEMLSINAEDIKPAGVFSNMFKDCRFLADISPQLINEKEGSTCNIIVENDGRWFDVSKLRATGFRLWFTDFYLTDKGTLIAYNSSTQIGPTGVSPFYWIASEAQVKAYEEWLRFEAMKSNPSPEKEV